MRPGLLEIAVILIVLIIIAIAARMFRANPRPVQRSRDAPGEAEIQRAEERPPGRRRYLRRVGIALILAGAVFLFAAIGMFRWAFQSYIWSFVLVVIGFVVVYLSRNR